MTYRVYLDDRLIPRRFHRRLEAIVFAKSAIVRNGVTSAYIYAFRPGGVVAGNFTITRDDILPPQTP